ncbi:MAG: hypothetical protein Q7S58_21405 [Candidatus Binatus sp.]|uniref:hypothetical protein n=1 Tax=Candidatus Binatus sp. TaxID=2811406 RepID=UPI002721AC74|nr:hypothetical protein [Candidatus Binatus sp.]MDO8434964.1 hypothetical protein [Candidatus Binatus sp.]
MASIRNGNGKKAPKKYVPSEKQRTEDERIKEKLERLTDADLREFDRVLERAFKQPQTARKSGD